jgi:hypothetical protein
MAIPSKFHENCNVKIIEKWNACVARGHQKVSVLKPLSAEHFNYSGCVKARQVECLMDQVVKSQSAHARGESMLECRCVYLHINANGPSSEYAD